MILQLNPPLPITTPKGKALAHFLLDYGFEHNLFWICFQEESGECWTWKNPYILAEKNITCGRTMKRQNKKDRKDESKAMKRKHSDEKQDKALIRKMVKTKDLKKE